MHPDAFLAARNMHACARRDTKKFILRGEHNLIHMKRRREAARWIKLIRGTLRDWWEVIVLARIAGMSHTQYIINTTCISVVRPQAAHRTLSTTIGCSARRLPNLPFFSQVEWTNLVVKASARLLLQTAEHTLCISNIMVERCARTFGNHCNWSGPE
jgi:hypothetical protein